MSIFEHDLESKSLKQLQFVLKDTVVSTTDTLQQLGTPFFIVIDLFPQI